MLELDFNLCLWLKENTHTKITQVEKETAYNMYNINFSYLPYFPNEAITILEVKDSLTLTICHPYHSHSTLTSTPNQAWAQRGHSVFGWLIIGTSKHGECLQHSVTHCRRDTTWGENKMIVTVLFGKANLMCENNPVRIIQCNTGFPWEPWDSMIRKHLTPKEALKQMKVCVCYSVWWNWNLGNLLPWSDTGWKYVCIAYLTCPIAYF